VKGYVVMKTQKTIGTVKIFRILWCAMMFFVVLLMTQQSDGGLLCSLGPYNAEFIYCIPKTYIDGVTYFNGNIYVTDGMSHIYQINRSGFIVAAWNTPIEEIWPPWGQSGGPGGIANDGTRMYACNQDTIFNVSLGTPPNSVCTPIGPIAESHNACDLVYGDGLLWASIYSDPKINEYDPISGAKIGSIPSPSSSVYSMAFDGTNLILTDFYHMWQVSTDGSVLDSWTLSASHGDLGMTYDFSTNTLLVVAPEPATMAMLGLGALALLRKRRA